MKDSGDIKEVAHPTDEIRVVETAPITAHNEALLEAGKVLLIQSIEIGRDFCKFMISICAGAIPVYLGLLKFVLSDSHAFTVWQSVFVISCLVLFAGALLVFVFGFFPQRSLFSLDIAEVIEKERKTTIRRRYACSVAGLVVFLVGVVIGAVSIISLLSTAAEATAT